MKVLLASLDSPATLQGGVEWYVHHLARALADEGHEVRVAARRPHATPSWLTGVDYRWAPLPLGTSSHRYRLLHEPRFWRHVRREAAWAEVVHSQNIDGLGAASVRPTVATVHTTPLDEWESSRLGGWREHLYQRHVERYRRLMWRRFVRRARHLVTPGAHVAESLRALGASDVEVLPNPIPPIERHDRLDARQALGLPGGPMVLYLGRLAQVKRVDRLLDAMRELPDSIQLVVAGEGPERARLEAFSDPARVRFVGRVDDAAKSLLLSTADVLCLPSEHEGQPLVLLEAMSVGLPVVATDAAWVPPEHQARGLWGTDLPALLLEALAKGRQPPAPVMDYKQTARRFGDIYASVVA